MKEKIPVAVRQVLQQLHKAGFEAYPVGGPVRDLLRGVTPHDWDITTSALPEQVMACFTDHRVIPTGLPHGTVTILAEEWPVEITSFRGEAGYSDGRHPDAVRFGVSLTEDLARRDFTIGAMALDIETDSVIDPFGGREDLAHGILRAVGEPHRRFEEDALRILRGLRFAAVLNLTVEPATAAALHECAPLLRRIAPERIRVELDKLLCGPSAIPILREYVDVLGVILPELLPMVGFAQNNPHHNKDVWEHTLAVVQNAPAEPVLRWAALLHDIGKPHCYTEDENSIGHFYGHPEISTRMAGEMLHRLRCDNRFWEDVTELVRIHDIRFPAEEHLAVRWAGRWGEERFRQFLALRRADTLGQADPTDAQRYCDAMEAHLAAAKAKNACFSLRELAVNGSDLLALGCRGKEVGDTLQQLLSAVQDGKLPNEREALLASLQK